MTDDSQPADRAATRIERDSMGEMAVPAEALYGASTQRAVLNFPISGQPMPAGFIHALALIKQAAAETNAELGLLDPEMARAIAAAAAGVAAGHHDDAFPIDIYQTGSGTSTNTNANEVIAHLASARLGRPVHPNDHVNAGQSSNDVIPTAMQLAAAIAIHETLLPALEHLQASLAATSGIHRASDVLKMLMAGADVTMLCSTLIRHGIGQISVIERELVAWMEEHEYESVTQLKGSLSQKNCPAPSAFERAQYMRAISTYSVP